MHREQCRGTVFHFFTATPPAGRRGFSLYEMLVVLTIVSILGSASASLGGVLRNERLSTGANDLMAALNLARSHAVMRLANVVVCPSRAGHQCDEPDSRYTWWQNGYLVFVDFDGDRRRDDNEPVLLNGSAKTGITLRSSRYRTRVVYRPDGMTTGSNLTLTFCPVGPAADVRSVIISNTGRARVSRAPVDHLPCD